MKAVNDLKLSYLIKKIKETFSLKMHNHDLSSEDMSGVLPVDKGGTGVSSLVGIKDLIGTVPLKVIKGTYTGDGNNQIRINFGDPDFYPIYMVITTETLAVTKGIPFIIPLIGERSFTLNSLHSYVDYESWELTENDEIYIKHGGGGSELGHYVQIRNDTDKEGLIRLYNDTDTTYYMMSIGVTNTKDAKSIHSVTTEHSVATE